MGGIFFSMSLVIGKTFLLKKVFRFTLGALIYYFLSVLFSNGRPVFLFSTTALPAGRESRAPGFTVLAK